MYNEISYELDLSTIILIFVSGIKRSILKLNGKVFDAVILPKEMQIATSNIVLPFSRFFIV